MQGARPKTTGDFLITLTSDLEMPRNHKVQIQRLYAFSAEVICSMDLGKVIPGSIRLKEQEQSMSQNMTYFHMLGGIRMQKTGSGSPQTAWSTISPSKGTSVLASVFYKTSL